MSAHAWFNRIWYREAQPPLWLLPLAALFGALARLRRTAYARQWLRASALSRPVIVIGNISVGGTGKTPLVSWLAEALRSRGFSPGIVTRGYGGTQRAARLLQPSDDAAVVGDEPLLLSRRTSLPVAVGRRRPAAAQLLIDAGCDVILSDDGLQHYALQRNCELAVIDAERGLGNARVLPAGPLREGPERLQGVDAIVMNGPLETGFESGKVPLIAMRLTGDTAIALAGGARRSLEQFAGSAVHAVAGIGNPGRFFELLKAHGLSVLAHPMADHAPLAGGDIRFADGLPVLMTEKDAVKCAPFAGAEHWYVPVDASFAPGEAERLIDIVLRAIQVSAATVRKHG